MRASRMSTKVEDQKKTDSLESMKSETSSYFNMTKSTKYHRVSNFEQQLQRLEQISRDVKLEADKVIKNANQIADKTLNQKADYHDYKRELPEQLLLDHYRFLNDRILRAEEAKIKMECTPELIDGMFRRYMPSTIGRRNSVIDCDLQDAYYSDQYQNYFNQARKILLECNEKNSFELDNMYEDQKRRNKAK